MELGERVGVDVRDIEAVFLVIHAEAGEVAHGEGGVIFAVCRGWGNGARRNARGCPAMRKNSTAMLNDIAAVLHHETTILSRLDAMAREIMGDYEGKPLTVVAIMNGGLILLADLLRRVQLPLKIETISVASYHGGTASSGTVTFLQTGVPDLRGRHVILLDDILDSGRTLEAVRARLLAESCPESLRICVLLQKRCERACAIEPDYVGFEIGDEFVVGYGLDYQGKYRNLPFIGVLRPEAIGEEA